MSRDTSYDALILGRSLERVDMTARLLTARIGAERVIEGWTSTLRACSAHDAYLRTYQQGVEAPRERAVSTISEEVTQRLFAGSPPPQWSLKETGA